MTRGDERQPSRLGLPQSTFWRFLFTSTLIAVVTAAAAMAIATFIGKGLIHEIQEEGSFAVLRSATDLVGRTRIADEQMRGFLMERQREDLRNTNDFTTSILETYEYQIRREGRDPAEARRTALARLNALSGPHHPLFVLDEDLRLVVHADPAYRGRSVCDLRDAEGHPVFRELVARAQAAPPGTTVFGLIPWADPSRTHREIKLVGARHYAPWNLTVCSDVFVEDLEEELAARRQANLGELQARLREILVSKSGYMFIMDEDCNVIAHPVLTGENLVGRIEPLSGRPLCDLVKEAADRPWGRNSFRYLWERPDDRGRFAHEKIAWCTREPTTGWYVAATAYVDEIEAGLPRFTRAIFLPALGSILVLGGALALLLRNLLKPVQDLSAVCRAVSHGNLEVMAPEDAPGEMGFLARHFNFMIRRLRGLRRKEERRRLDLEALNRELEKVVEVRTRALKRKAHNLEQANRSLKELDSMKSAFLSSVSHELRTPLTSVLGFAKLISRDFLKHFWPLARNREDLERRGQRILGNLDIILQEGERLTRLVNDVLDLNKIESGRVDWHDREMHLSEAVERAVAAARPQFGEKLGVELSVEVDPDLPSMRLDSDRLVQVFLNLLHNAIKFTAEGRVSVRVFRRDGHVRAEVADTGIGVAPADQERIFDKFHQVRQGDTTREKPQGTGLGLAICRQIVERYGGRIWVESEPGVGSTFILELPLTPAPRESAPTPEAVEVPQRPDKALVLVADDDPAVNAYLSQLLEAEGLEVVQAFDGESAVKKAGAYQPDLVVMDILMPGMDGRTAITLLRRDPRTAAIPIMVVTALPEAGDMGGDVALQKPVDERAFLEAVNCLLNRRGSGRPVLALRRNGETVPGPFFALCPAESIVHCDEDELWRRVNEGFQGTILLPDWAVERLDMSSLAARSGIHLLILPEDRSEDRPAGDPAKPGKGGDKGGE